MRACTGETQRLQQSYTCVRARLAWLEVAKVGSATPAREGVGGRASAAAAAATATATATATACASLRHERGAVGKWFRRTRQLTDRTNPCHLQVRYICSIDCLSRRAAMRLKCMLLLSLFWLLCIDGPAAHASAPDRPLWQQLQPGPFTIGFRSLFAFDRSREWLQTRPFHGGFSPDPNGRPIRIDIWYPAKASGGAAPMTFGDYVTVHAPPGFEALQRQVRGRDMLIATLDVHENDP